MTERLAGTAPDDAGRLLSDAAAAGPGLRVFAIPEGRQRSRRGTDLVLLVPALIGVLLAVVAYPPSGFESSLQALLASIPAWLDPVWGFLADALWLWAIVLMLIALLRRRLGIVGQALAALALATVIGLVAARLAIGSWPEVASAVTGSSHGPPFPNVRVALASAVVVTVAPYLVRPLRVLGRWILALGVTGAAVISGVTPMGTLTALLIAVAAAAGVRLALGTSIGRPPVSLVAAGLAGLGVAARGLEPAERQVAGVFQVRGTDEAGRALTVKVYGRDAYDTQLVARSWRRLWYQGAGPPIGVGRLQAAEHEAFVTLLAGGAGLPTHEVVTAAATATDDALLVLRGDARPLASLEPGRIDDAMLRGAWWALAVLGGLGIAHRQIAPETVVLIDGAVGFVDLAGATVGRDVHLLATDRAQLLMATACLAGSERALDTAISELGREGVADLLPYLQSAATTTELHRALRAHGQDVDALREEAAARVGVDPPELARLRRVSWRSAIQVGLLALASYAILTAAGGVDWGEVSTALEDAAWGWIALALLVAQLPRLTQAVATLGSVPARLPFGPVYAMQLATGYMNVALPSNLARMAVSIRFFQRQGLSAPTAVASGAIDSFASTAVQAVLLALLLAFSGSSLEVSLPLPSGGARTLLVILIAVVLVSALVLALVPRLRRGIAGHLRRWGPEIRAALSGLRSSDKLGLLLLGSLATEVLFAAALGLFAHGFGYDISLAELLVINIGVSLLGSLVPVPGNIGVAEFGLTVGLVAAGMTEETAFAAVLLYRIATFYLPPLWGFVALGWLQRNRYL